MRKVEVRATIGVDGQVAITDVHGVRGRQCVDVPQDVEAALGPVLSVQPKPEFYQMTAVAQTQIQMCDDGSVQR